MTRKPIPHEPLRSEIQTELGDQHGREAVAQRMALLVARMGRDALYAASNGHTRAPRQTARASRSSLHGYERPEAGTV